MKNFQLLSVLLLLSSSHFPSSMYATDINCPRTQEDVRKAFEELDKKLILILADNAKSRESFLLALDAEVKEGPITAHMNTPQVYRQNGDFDTSKKEAYSTLELAKKVAYDRCSKETEAVLATDNLDSYKKQISIASLQHARDVACNYHSTQADAYIKALVNASSKLINA